MQSSNVGERGPGSIRVAGMRIEDLPIAEQAAARQQLPLVLDMDRRNQIENIIVGSPKQDVSYLKARIAECLDSIGRIGDLKTRELALIAEYTGHITLCRYRDDLLEKETDPDRIREIERKFPPYNVEKMEQQIEQSKASIARAEAAIEQEHASIRELNAVVGKCEVRDQRLRALGVRIGRHGH